MSKLLIASSADIVENKVFATKYNDEPILVTRTQGLLYAVSGKCPHLGLPLKGGKVANGKIICPWHGAQFNLSTGANIKWVNSTVGIPLPKWTHKFVALGKKPCGLKKYNVIEENASVYLIV